MYSSITWKSQTWIYKLWWKGITYFIRTSHYDRAALARDECERHAPVSAVCLALTTLAENCNPTETVVTRLGPFISLPVA